jgi:hypothetical protein
MVGSLRWWKDTRDITLAEHRTLRRRKSLVEEFELADDRWSAILSPLAEKTLELIDRFDGILSFGLTLLRTIR